MTFLATERDYDRYFEETKRDTVAYYDCARDGCDCEVIWDRQRRFYTHACGNKHVHDHFAVRGGRRS